VAERDEYAEKLERQGRQWERDHAPGEVFQGDDRIRGRDYIPAPGEVKPVRKDNPIPKRRNKSYIQTVRKERKELNDLKRTLKDIERFEQIEKEKPAIAAKRARARARYKQREKLRKSKYKPVELPIAGKRESQTYADAVRLQRERRHEQRTQLLFELCRDRVCKCCNKKRLNSKSWVYLKKAHIVICKGCYQKIKSCVHLDESFTFEIAKTAIKEIENVTKD
jgi:hypothetical protein